MCDPRKEKVTRVYDGNTFRTMYQPTVRLEGVCTPESHEPGHLEAKKGLTQLILQKDVRIHTKREDSRGHRIAQVLRASDGLNVNKEMQRYCK